MQSLHRALGEGRLDLAETEARVTAAYAAVFRNELPALLGDLPQDDPPAAPQLAGTGAPSCQTLWIALVWRARASLWDSATAAGRTTPPDPGQRRIAALLLALAGLWVMICAVIGALL